MQSRIKKYGFIECEDYTSFNKFIKREIGSSTTTEYAISIDMAKELGMLENNKAGNVIRSYFIAMEERAKRDKYTMPTKRDFAQ